MPDHLNSDTVVYTDSLLLLPDEQRAAVSSDGRSLLIRLFRWGEVGATAQGRETFARGALDGIDATRVVIESQRHDADIVGRGEAIEDDGEGPMLRARISDTTAGNDLLTLIQDKVLSAASVVFSPITSRRRPDGVIERLKADLKRVAILESGAFPSAQVLEVRSAPMDGEVLTSEAAAPSVDLSPIFARLDGVDEAIRAVMARADVPGVIQDQRPELLKRHATLGEAWLVAVESDEDRGLLKRALADQTTATNPGLIPTGFLSTVYGIVNLGRRAVAAFGGPRPLPAEGMTFTWPKVSAATITAREHVAVQATEKAAILSEVVNFDSPTAVAIKTIAGGSDISYQLLRRSTPSYRDAYAREMLTSWARFTEADFVASLVAGSGATSTVTLTGTAAAASAAFIAELFAQSVAIEAATGQPASLVLAASNVFVKLGGILTPPAYGTQNLPGVAQASTLQVNASGLNVVHVPALAAGKYIISNSGAAALHEEGPMTVEAEDVEKLGRNVAFWSMNATAVYIPTAVVLGTATLV